MALRFPKNPPASLADFFHAVADLVDQLQPEPRVIAGKEVDTSETIIAHGQKGKPQFVHITKYANEDVWQTQPADERYVYLQASGTVTVDIQVTP